MYLFSQKKLAFYPVSEKQSYIDAGSLPGDVIEVSEGVRDIFNGQPPDNHKLGVDGKGMPVWTKLSKEEYVINAQAIKKNFIREANYFINDKQWPGKAAIGRLNGDELAMYNLWLDYLDALEAVDTSSAPDIEWPTTPESQAR